METSAAQPSSSASRARIYIAGSWRSASARGTGSAEAHDRISGRGITCSVRLAAPLGRPVFTSALKKAGVQGQVRRGGSVDQIRPTEVGEAVPAGSQDI